MRYIKEQGFKVTSNLQDHQGLGTIRNSPGRFYLECFGTQCSSTTKEKKVN